MPSNLAVSTRVAVLETQMREVKSDVAQIRADIRKLVWLVLGAIIIAAANFVVQGGLVTVARTIPNAAAVALPSSPSPGGSRETVG